MKIIPLNHGIYAVNKQKIFSSFSLENANEEQLKELKIAICPFLIVLKNEIILLDTGLGFIENGAPVLLHLIEKAGYKANQITKVLISHFHKDHIGGIGFFDERDEFVPNFPNAVVYMQKRELDFASEQKQSPSYDFKILNQLKSLPNVVMLDNDKGEITKEISYEVSKGHTPFHQVFRIKEEDEIAFYGADDLPQKAYLELHVAYKTDYDGKRAMESRKKWEKEAREQHWKVLLYHDMKTPVLEF
ncbi:MBL fold metallo-hydrolase [Flavobacterium sp. FlaQc-48]|uniref:MBL fold metallo-hydrolase n=1 Tax=Flavobacterium sp. FlaQc-48 TaxID=3374181 RepID=UPI003756C651